MHSETKKSFLTETIYQCYSTAPNISVTFSPHYFHWFLLQHCKRLHQQAVAPLAYHHPQSSHSCTGSRPIGGQCSRMPASYWLNLQNSLSLSSHSNLAAASNTNLNLRATTPCVVPACSLCNRLSFKPSILGRRQIEKDLFWQQVSGVDLVRCHMKST